jgi:hypothetical protein
VGYATPHPGILVEGVGLVVEPTQAMLNSRDRAMMTRKLGSIPARPSRWLSVASVCSVTNLIGMLTKRLTKIGDSTGLVIDRPLLDLLGLDRG